MEIINTISGIGTLVVAIIGIWIAIAQILSANRDAHASRMTEMSWQIYQAYVEPRMRDARGAAEKIACTVPIPASGFEYGEQYADNTYIVPEPNNVSLDTHIRRLLRFYNQVGILVEKKLVDDDFVFEFIGPGLKNVWPVILVVIDWYQNYHTGLTGNKRVEPRRIFSYVTILYEQYIRWENSAKKL